MGNGFVLMQGASSQQKTAGMAKKHTHHDHLPQERESQLRCTVRKKTSACRLRTCHPQSWRALLLMRITQAGQEGP